MKTKTPRAKSQKILRILFWINVAAFIFGVLPPPARANYLPTILTAISILFFFYALFCTPIVFIASTIYSIVQPIKNKD